MSEWVLALVSNSTPSNSKAGGTKNGLFITENPSHS